MGVRNLTALLTQACAILEPFTRFVAPGALVYDGTRYAPSTPQSGDPFALAWWSSFRSTIALLDDAAKLTPGQRDYLLSTLCGGMGGFNDFTLNERHWGSIAVTANQQLDSLRDQMLSALNDPDEDVA